MCGGHAMNMHGIIPGFPLPDNKCRGQVSREGQATGHYLYVHGFSRVRDSGGGMRCRPTTCGFSRARE